MVQLLSAEINIIANITTALFMTRPYSALLVISVLILFLLPATSKAAFPINNNGTVVLKNDAAYHEKINEAIAKFTHYGEGTTSHSGKAGMGMAALILGVGGLFFIAAALLVPGVAFLGSLGFISSVLAIVFGAIGLKGENAGMARAGMILGIVTVGLMLIFAIIAALVAIAFLAML